MRGVPLRGSVRSRPRPSVARAAAVAARAALAAATRGALRGAGLLLALRFFPSLEADGADRDPNQPTEHAQHEFFSLGAAIARLTGQQSSCHAGQPATEAGRR